MMERTQDARARPVVVDIPCNWRFVYTSSAPHRRIKLHLPGLNRSLRSAFCVADPFVSPMIWSRSCLWRSGGA